MQKQKKNIWYPLLFGLTMAVGMWLGFSMKEKMPGKPFFGLDKTHTIEEVISLIENKYVDDVNTQNLSDTAIAAILSKLDPHSQYIPADMVEDVNEDIAGGYYGIGIEFDVFDDTMHVIHVIKNGPGAKAGLLFGDKIITAGDSVIAGRKKSIEEMRRVLRGNKGSVLALKIKRGNKFIHLSVSRGIIPVTSIDAGYMINDSTGYIRINKFTQNTYREFMEVLDGMMKKGKTTQLVLDLRGNGGGVLDEAVEIADEFLSSDKLITYTEGKHYPRKEYRCRREGLFQEGKLVVLTDEETASASEVLIGALQDWDRATIIGRRTFGKGLVQEQYDLSDGSALRITVSRYYTPLGRSIQRSYANGSDAYFEEVMDRMHDTVDAYPPNGKVYFTKNGKKVYDGGGITPDVLLNSDSTKPGKMLYPVFEKGLVKSFGYQFSLIHPQIRQQFSNPRLFMKEFSIEGAPWQFFESMAAKDSIFFSSISNKEINKLGRYLKLAIAQQLWRNEGYYEAFNEDDQTFKAALEVLKKK